MFSKIKIKDFNKKFDVVALFIENNKEILLLQRQNGKSQAGTWGIPAGKVDLDDSNLLSAIVREVKEETGLTFKKEEVKYFNRCYVRYDDFDFEHHIFSVRLTERPKVKINQEEHKDFVWISPENALKLNLIQDEDSCIKWFYNIEN